MTTGDEISLNYHSVGLGSAACHAAAAWAGRRLGPGGGAVAAPHASPGESAPSRRSPRGMSELLPGGSEGCSAGEEKYKMQLAQLGGGVL